MTLDQKVWNIAAGSAFVLVACLVFLPATSAFADGSFGAPTQAQCTNGSTTVTWDGEGVDRPVIASVTVDGEEITGFEDPADGDIGASICPNTTQGKRTGLFLYHRTGSDNDFDMSTATTPLGNPVTEDSDITITLTNMGEHANLFTFALVHGAVSSWTTSGLGTDAAALTVTMSPVRTPFGSGDDFNFCTATPPTCTATQSDLDVITASLDLSFDANVGTSMRGAYFALTGAMGGWVESITQTDGTKSLKASLGAPHFLADGTTLNTGSMQAFLPTAVINGLFGLAADDISTSTLDITRTTGSTTTSDVSFTAQSVTGGVLLSVPTITFSSPKYTIKMTTAGVAKKKSVATKASRSKTKIVVDGKNVKANGKSFYKVTMKVRNKFGKVINVQPTFRTASKNVKIGKTVKINGVWVTKITATGTGKKIIRVTANGVFLQNLGLTFIHK